MTFSEKNINEAIESYNKAFYHASNQVGYYAVSTKGGKPDHGHFWQTCEQIEALEDAYQRTKSPIYKGMITELVNGLNQVVSKDKNTDWASWNDYNDDIMWGVIALARAYELTGKTNNSILQQAQAQFNAVWSRGFDAELGGGIWWKIFKPTEQKSKNACVNFPAIIAAMYLKRITNNDDFGTKADQLWSWSRKNLYNESTGQVYDNKAPGK